MTEKPQNLTLQARADKALEWFDAFVSDNQPIIDEIDELYSMESVEGANASTAIGELSATLARNLAQALDTKEGSQTPKLDSAVNEAKIGLKEWITIGRDRTGKTMEFPEDLAESKSRERPTLRVVGDVTELQGVADTAKSQEQASSVDRSAGLSPQLRADLALEWFDEAVKMNKDIITAIDAEHTATDNPDQNATSLLYIHRNQLEYNLNEALRALAGRQVQEIQTAFNTAVAEFAKIISPSFPEINQEIRCPERPPELDDKVKTMAVTDTFTAKERWERRAAKDGWGAKPL